MAETESDGSTPQSGPTPQTVQTYFRIGKKPLPETAEITPELTALAVLLNPRAFAEQMRRLTTSGKAYFGALLLGEALAERLPELKAALAKPPPRGTALHDEYRSHRVEYRALLRLLQALGNAEPSMFFQQGQLASIRHGEADANRKATGIMQVYAGVGLVLKQNNRRVGNGSSSVACKVTAALLTEFGPWKVVTPHMVSNHVREELRHRDKTWRDRWV